MPLLPLPSARCAAADAATDRAIDRGVKYLLGQVQANPFGPHTFGSMALETYALVVAGVPLEHPLMRTNFTKLNKGLRKSRNTYTLSCYIFALDAAIAQAETDYLLSNPGRAGDVLKGKKTLGKRFLPYLHSATAALVEMQNARGAWRYGPGPDFDNSCSQFAVLAIGIGARRGARVPRSVWEGIQRHFLKEQETNGATLSDRLTLDPEEERGRRDRVELVRAGRAGPKRGAAARSGGRGKTVVRPRTIVPKDDPVIGTEDITVRQRGWNYQSGGASWNMTCAGLSSLLIVRENLKRGAGDGEWKALIAGIRDGFGWIMGNWSLTETYYGLYSLEKCADIGGVKKFGPHDWYDEAKRHLVAEQQADGSWKGTGKHGEVDRVATAFALLILRRATRLLTRDAGGGIVVTGRAATPKTAEDREWVYLPSIDTSLHYPTILDVLRKRPSVKLAKFLRDIVEAYPEQYRGELVPQLSRALESAATSRLEKVFREHLALVTGVESGDPGLFETWHERWQKVVAAGTKRDRKMSGELLDWYQDDLGSVPLKRTTAWALTRIGVKKALPHFFRDLDHDSAEVRLLAYESFKTYFSETVPPFDPGARGRQREEQIQAIKDWFSAWQKKRRGS